MQVYLIRHAHAGQRNNDGRDIYRPLSQEGHDRAAELVGLFADTSIDVVLSSPASRCAQTVEPLAAANGLTITECPELWEGSSITEALALFESGFESGLESRIDPQNATRVVACSHGDMIPALIDLLGGRGVPITGRGCGLGSIWALEFDGEAWQSARYINNSRQALT